MTELTTSNLNKNDDVMTSLKYDSDLLNLKKGVDVGKSVEIGHFKIEVTAFSFEVTVTLSHKRHERQCLQFTMRYKNSQS